MYLKNTFIYLNCNVFKYMFQIYVLHHCSLLFFRSETVTGEKNTALNNLIFFSMELLYNISDLTKFDIYDVRQSFLL